MSVVQISEKGQIVIPARMRKKYGLNPQSKLDIMDLGGQIVLCPLPDDPIEAADGILKSEKSVLEMMREARKEEMRLERKK